MSVFAVTRNCRRFRGAVMPDRAGRGLTLVEVLIALSVLAAVLLPVMLGFAQALMTTSGSSVSAVATSIARARIENLKAQTYDQIQSQGATAADLRAGDSYFRVSVTVTEVEPNDLTSKKGLKLAVVSVYQAGSSRPLVTLTTYFTPVGV